MIKGLALISAAMLAAPFAANAAPAIPMPAGGVSVKGPDKTETIGRWVVLHQADSMTDELDYTAALPSVDGEGMIAFGCSPRLGSSSTMYRGGSLFTVLKEPRNLTYRFDDGPAVTFAWSFEGQMGTAMGDEADRLITGLERHGRLRVRVADASGNPDERTFDLAGASAALARMRVLCAGGR